MSLTVEAVRRAATDERDRLQAGDEWRIAFSGAEAAEPLLVKPTAPAPNYYIVQFRQNSRTSGLMLVDPEDGEVGAVTGIETPGQSLCRFVRPEEIPQLLEMLAHSRELPDGVPPDLRASNVRVQPVLFWEACDQSLSPFYPFYRVGYAGPQKVDNFLLRVDGKVFLKTTHGGAGM